VVPAATLYLHIVLIEGVEDPWTLEIGGLGGGLWGFGIANDDICMFGGGHLWQWALAHCTMSCVVFGVLYTRPPVSMDSMRTCVESTLSLHGLHEDSMRTLWGLWGLHGEFMTVGTTVYIESTQIATVLIESSNCVSWTLWGLRKESTQYSPQSLRRLHENSLPYLFN
jgi:hypothetical protein